MKNGRDSRGRFTKGSRGNPGGRPKSHKNIQALLLQRCTPAKQRKIIDRAIEDAIAGDSTARRWVYNYLLGKPVERVKAEISQHPITLDEWLERADQRLKEFTDADSAGGE